MDEDDGLSSESRRRIEKKRKKHLDFHEKEIGMATCGGRGKGGCKGQVAGHRLRWVTVDVTGWHWLKGLCLWDSVTGSETRSCGVGLGWDSTRRCFPILGVMTN